MSRGGDFLDMLVTASDGGLRRTRGRRWGGWEGRGEAAKKWRRYLGGKAVLSQHSLRQTGKNIAKTAVRQYAAAKRRAGKRHAQAASVGMATGNVSKMREREGKRRHAVKMVIRPGGPACLGKQETRPAVGNRQRKSRQRKSRQPSPRF
jgi:hypothetical protein